MTAFSVWYRRCKDNRSMRAFSIHCAHYLSSHWPKETLTQPIDKLVFVVIFFKTMHNKTIIRFGFCEFRNNNGLGKCY